MKHGHMLAIFLLLISSIQASDDKPDNIPEKARTYAWGFTFSLEAARTLHTYLTTQTHQGKDHCSIDKIILLAQCTDPEVRAWVIQQLRPGGWKTEKDIKREYDRYMGCISNYIDPKNEKMLDIMDSHDELKKAAGAALHKAYHSPDKAFALALKDLVKKCAGE